VRSCPTAVPAPTAHADESALPSYTHARTRAIEEFDRTYLAKLLAKTHGNVSEAARLAGKERRTLGKLIKRYAIQPNAFRG
jgi:two-component system, NtrC family, response regulator GlrR